MERALRLIADYQWWIYGVFGLLLMFYLRRAIMSRRESVRSIFALEQEQSRARYSRSVVLAAAALLFMAAIFGLTNILLPRMEQPPEEPIPTATAGPLPASTLTSTPQPPTMTPTATETKERPTPLVRPSPTLDLSPTVASQVQAPVCANPGVRVTSPGVGQVLTANAAMGGVPVRGTANIPGFQYYKIEVGPGANPKDGEWVVVGQLHETPVVDGVLETFNASAYPPGTYTLQLVVVDETGNYPPPCRVTVSIQR